MEELAAVPAALFDWQHLYATLAVVAVLFVLEDTAHSVFSLYLRDASIQAFIPALQGWKRGIAYTVMGAAFIVGMMLMVFCNTAIW